MCAETGELLGMGKTCTLLMSEMKYGVSVEIGSLLL